MTGILDLLGVGILDRLGILLGALAALAALAEELLALLGLGLGDGEGEGEHLGILELVCVLWTGFTILGPRAGLLGTLLVWDVLRIFGLLSSIAFVT